MTKTVQQALAEIRKLSTAYTYDTATEIDQAQPLYCPQWADCVGNLVQLGTLLVYNNVKYRIMQAHTPQAHQPPDGEGMTALYMAYRGADNKLWKAGEYAEIGYQRICPETGGTYVAVQSPGANLYAPSLVPAVWEVMTDDAASS